MASVGPVLAAHPRAGDSAPLAAAVDAALACLGACSGCADACISEHRDAMLSRCIRLDLDCADVCAATARVLTRNPSGPGDVARAVLEACVIACVECAAECEKHGAHGMEHCRLCAEACRECEKACRAVLETMLVASP
jgi:hypothetical protein